MSAAGQDGLFSRLLEDMYEIFLSPLVHILNLSLSQGTVPSDLNAAQITGLFKNMQTHSHM